MVNTSLAHDTKWVSPSPLWPELADTDKAAVRNTFRRPTILRFDSDDFMDELLSLMEHYPERLVEWQAQPETWREPMAAPSTQSKLNVSRPLSNFRQNQTRQLKAASTVGAGADFGPGSEVMPSTDKPLKLYQPAHKRFYLVTASLVCRRIGLPDRLVDNAKQQTVRFVIRRLLPKESSEIQTPEICNVDDCNEYAFINDESGSYWQQVQSNDQVNENGILDSEERLPMFNLGYDETEEKRRRLLAGFIPAGKREAYVNAELREAAKGEGSTPENLGLSDQKRDAIVQLFSMQVAGPWKSVITTAYNELKSAEQWADSGQRPALFGFKTPPSEPINSDNVKLAREKIQTVSWYVLVDILGFLKDYIPNVYEYIKNASAPANISQAEQALYDALQSISFALTQPDLSFFNSPVYHEPADLEPSMVSALKRLIDNPSIEADLDLIDYPYDRENEVTDSSHSWPSFLFPLADPLHDTPAPQPLLSVSEPSDAEPDISHDQIDAITELVRAAISSNFTRPAPDLALPKLAKVDRRDGWFVIRCVYETPNCGPFQLPVISNATVPFQMASFFDPDAPGRPITIPMPLDISPAGLRKFNKNASFMISDMLCGKLKGMRKNTLGDLVLSVLPWPFHKDLPDPGSAVCSKGGTGFGMICSFSIPIVTICAMILMIIMVTLFDIFFRWLPYLFLCLPVPGLKGKKDA